VTDVVGAAEIIITPVTAGFEEALHAQTATPLGNFGKRAEKAGEEGGQKLSKGFSSGTSGIGRTLNNLGVPFANFGGHLTTTADKMAKVDQSGSHLGATMATLGGHVLLGVGVAMAGVAAAGVDLAVKQEKVTAAIANSEGISVKAANSISNAFLATAGTTIFSGKAIGEAYAKVAGELGAVVGHALSAGEATKVMAASMDLAEASGIELGAATDSLGKIMLAYHLNAGQAAGASDVLFNASKQTGTSVEQLASQLQRMRGRLGDLAPSLAESGGLMELLAKHGITGRMSLMALNGAFNTLLSGGTKTQEMMKQLGIHVFDSSGKFVGLTSVIAQLQPKLVGLNQQSQLQATRALFGASANKQLLDIILQGPHAYQASTAAVQRHGAAADAAKKQSETLGGQMKILRATVEDLATKIGQALIPIITKLAKGLSEGIDWLKKHEAAAKVLAGVIATVLGAAIGSFVAVKVAAFIGGTKNMIAAMVSMGKKMLETAGIMGTADAAIAADAEATAVSVDASLMGTGIGVAVVALGIAAYELSQHWEAAMKGMEEATVAAANFIIGILNSLIDVFNETIGEITGDIGKIQEMSVEASGFTHKQEEENEAEGTPREVGGSKSATQGGIMAFFESKGLTRAQAAGIVGNIEQESSTNPNAPGGGLFQGIGSRSGLGSGSVKQQIEAAWKELSSNPEYGLAQLKKAKSPEEAARIFSQHFEKPGQPEVQNREKYAREALKQHPAEAKHTSAMEHHSKALEGAGHLQEAAAKTQHKAATVHHSAAKQVSESPKEIVKWAEQMVGHFKESTGSNRGPELDKLQGEFHTRAAAWCAEFATTAAMMGGANKAVRTASVKTIREWAEAGSHGYEKGVKKTPKAGDLMMFGDSHVGFVQSVHGSTVQTIEGNVGGSGGVAHETRKVGEGDFARPAYKKLETGAVELQRVSKQFETAQKEWVAKVSADTKQGQDQLNKITGAIQSGGVKELTAVVGGKHDTWLNKLVAKLHSDHTAGLDKMVTKLVDAHKKALEALKVALVKAAEKATAEKLSYEDKIHTDQAERQATLIANQAKTTLDRAAMVGKQGADLFAAQAQVALDEWKERDDVAISLAKQAVDETEGHGERAEAEAKQRLVNTENTAKVNETSQQAAVEMANNAAQEAKSAEERDKTEKERLKVEEERLAQEKKTTAEGATQAPVNFTITIPDGTKMSAGELLQEISWHIHTGTLPVAK
jgi:TP901 family phage tail tape measure protein